MPNILVVEDTQSERQLISALLNYAGFTTAAACSAEDAWNWLDTNPLPDLILLDIIMPGETGLDLCRKIRSHPQWKEVPILFCSSKAEEFDRFWALRQGGSDYITKPFAPQQFLDTVSRYVQH
ncbi:response regulator receiver protein [Rippkaea orientalis PCC 8801]|uniref:Response regulator receiver protein n=1 Tax=Rippkaea orientalis (strain PCC 8801 / RF-1) TaxID=41431 RepID=B7JV75_RIPO1|nr:response regulator [Rippkaea orientalis]ACK68208.1 response regulator receiver protein [Rippkaea orientalis PCC 8801]